MSCHWSHITKNCLDWDSSPRPGNVLRVLQFSILWQFHFHVSRSGVRTPVKAIFSGFFLLSQLSATKINGEYLFGDLSDWLIWFDRDVIRLQHVSWATLCVWFFASVSNEKWKLSIAKVIENIFFFMIHDTFTKPAEIKERWLMSTLTPPPTRLRNQGRRKGLTAIRCTVKQRLNVQD